MTNAFGGDLADQLAARYYNDSTVTVPASVYIKLHSGDPGEDGTANELDPNAGAAGYQPVEAVIPGDWNQGADASIITNERLGDFGPAQENWPEVTHYSIWTTQDQTGTVEYKDALTQGKTVENGDPVVIVAGQLEIDHLE